MSRSISKLSHEQLVVCSNLGLGGTWVTPLATKGRVKRMAPSPAGQFAGLVSRLASIHTYAIFKAFSYTGKRNDDLDRRIGRLGAITQAMGQIGAWLETVSPQGPAEAARSGTVACTLGKEYCREMHGLTDANGDLALWNAMFLTESGWRGRSWTRDRRTKNIR
eukprot:2623239-Amphidinium_carterae.1